MVCVCMAVSVTAWCERVCMGVSVCENRSAHNKSTHHRKRSRPSKFQGLERMKPEENQGILKGGLGRGRSTN